MYVIALRQEAVLRNAGSYETRPSPSGSLILPSSVAWIAPSTIGNVYSAPVRLSTTGRVAALTMPPLVEDQSIGCPPASLWPWTSLYARGRLWRRKAAAECSHRTERRRGR